MSQWDGAAWLAGALSAMLTGSIAKKAGRGKRLLQAAYGQIMASKILGLCPLEDEGSIMDRIAAGRAAVGAAKALDAKRRMDRGAGKDRSKRPKAGDAKFTLAWFFLALLEIGIAVAVATWLTLQIHELFGFWGYVFGEVSVWAMLIAVLSYVVDRMLVPVRRWFEINTSG